MGQKLWHGESFMASSPLSICVFCGSRPGENPAYVAAAQAMGGVIGANGWRLVYGAGDAGMMGTVAQAARDHGGTELGVIPTHLIGHETEQNGARAAIITETMHERKKVMVMNSDAFVILPGGAGSLDEFFEILTWAQLGLHAKPIIVANIDGFWSPLISLVDHIVDQGFASQSLKELFQVLETIDEITQTLTNLGRQTA